MKRQTPFTLVLHLILIGTATVSLLPFLWLACASLKRSSDLFAYDFLPWGHLNRLSFENFVVLFRREAFARWLVNSLFVASLQTVLVLLLSSLGGFALCKYSFKGKRPLMLLMLLTLMLPSHVLLPSSYELMRQLGWLNTFAAIIVPGSVSVFGMFLFRQAMHGVSDELLNAGRIDGCSELRLWWDISLPIVRPMIGAFTLMSFIGCWNSFLWPQIVLQDEAQYTLPIGLANMMSLPEYQTEYGVLMSGTLLSILPVIILFFGLQKDFVAGLASGAVKG